MMKYEEDTVLTLTYGKLKELLYEVQEDGVDSDGGAFSLVYENLDQFIINKIEEEKSIAVCKSRYNSIKKKERYKRETLCQLKF